MTSKQSLLAVLIDADNISADDAKAILKEVTRFGEPALRRVYGDWNSGQLNQWREKVRELGLVARQETANISGKNATDIGLVIDAMDVLYTGRFDGFVIVSSDSDFTALANRLREDGVTVIGIGKSHAPSSFRNVCNRFVLIENITEQDDATPSSQKKTEPASKHAQKSPPSKAVPMVLKAMKDIDPELDWYRLSALGSQINRAEPEFDPRTFGSSKLSELLDKTGQFELLQSNGHWEVRRKL